MPLNMRKDFYAPLQLPAPESLLDLSQKNKNAAVELAEKVPIETIKKAYKKLALALHPDKNGGSEKSQEQFKKLIEAYEVLSDAETRTVYDRFRIQEASKAFNKTQAQAKAKARAQTKAQAKSQTQAHVKSQTQSHARARTQAWAQAQTSHPAAGFDFSGAMGRENWGYAPVYGQSDHRQYRQPTDFAQRG
jgi:curved DNA-binding protein CbpA